MWKQAHGKYFKFEIRVVLLRLGYLKQGIAQVIIFFAEDKKILYFWVFFVLCININTAHRVIVRKCKSIGPTYNASPP
jgi:hypothetical protein